VDTRRGQDLQTKAGPSLARKSASAAIWLGLGLDNPAILHERKRNAAVLSQKPVALGVSDQQGSGEIDVPLLLRLQNQAGAGLAAIASAFFMGTVEDVIEDGALRGQLGAHSIVQREQVGVRHNTQRDAALIGDYDGKVAGGLKQTDPGDGRRQQAEFFPAADVCAFRRRGVDDSIPVEEEARPHHFTEARRSTNF